jgi:hypothetical protein
MRALRIRVTPLPLAVVALAAVLASALGGCGGGGPATDGPLGGGAFGSISGYHDSAGTYVTSNDLAMTIAVNKPACS